MGYLEITIMEDKMDNSVKALIVEALYDLYEYMGQFPDDLNLAVMEERIKLIESEYDG